MRICDSGKRWLLFLLVSGLFWGGMALSAQAEKIKYYDLYLTNNRVCKKCTWEWIDARRVQISNRQGQSAIVEGSEILAYDNHPFLRKVFVKGVHGVGLPGPVIVPYAFDDYKDYVCKYCDP